MRSLFARRHRMGVEPLAELIFLAFLKIGSNVCIFFLHAVFILCKVILAHPISNAQAPDRTTA